jgi:uncharacterized membrane protein YgcG
MAAASDLRARVHNHWVSAGFVFGISVAIVIAFTIVVLGGRPYTFGVLAISGLGVSVLALLNSVRNHARLALSPERLELRKRLLAARVYFERELAKATPNMNDAAYPYLLAFGLGSHVDKWFRAFGGEAQHSNRPAMVPNVGGGRSSGSGGGFTGFGGGGGFSGGGGGASFGAAIGGMASSVAAPSSSSGGGSRSGGRSGGGGGGGW